MPMAGCGSCGRVETIPGHPEARIGTVYTECPECGTPLHWVGILEAVSLVREHHKADLRALNATHAVEERV
jgi:hypothetical protein